jgi:hypothetical protein
VSWPHAAQQLWQISFIFWQCHKIHPLVAKQQDIHLRPANSWNGSLSNVSHFQFLISEFMICIVWLPVNTMECFWGFTIYFSLSNTPFSNWRLWKFCYHSGHWVCALVSATGVINCHQPVSLTALSYLLIDTSVTIWFLTTNNLTSWFCPYSSPIIAACLLCWWFTHHHFPVY